MYEYRNLCEHEQMDLVRKRMKLDRPWHAPPHSKGCGTYFITAACYEHADHLADSARRAAFCKDMHEAFASAGGKVFAWVVLPNHYHVLWEGDLDLLGPCLAQLHNGTSTRWNREDNAPRRQVWFRFTDREIRSEGHFFASVSYVHGNPVKHGWVRRADLWKESSLSEWVQRCGIEHLREIWRLYPPRDYGRGWDD